jgi:hypothetical protein
MSSMLASLRGLYRETGRHKLSSPPFAWIGSSWGPRVPLPPSSFIVGNDDVLSYNKASYRQGIFSCQRGRLKLTAGAVFTVWHAVTSGCCGGFVSLLISKMLTMTFPL